MMLPAWPILVGTLVLTWPPTEARRPEVRGPSWAQENAIYYQTFDSDRAEIDKGGIEAPSPSSARRVPTGLTGAALDAISAPLKLKGPTLSPHRPLTISFWWALSKDLPIDGAFGLFGLTGKGYIGAFTRGKGEWCALQRPAGVLQVYYFQHIQNVNDIYDTDLAAHVELKAGVWHHAAVVFRQAASVALYIDGREVAGITTSGRDFSADDDLTTLELGGGVYLDELLILDRALDSEQIADYYRGMRRLREYASGTASRAGAEKGRIGP